MNIDNKEILKSLTQDLNEHGPQSSWDFEADYRFACIINHPDKDNIGLCVTGESPWPIRKSYLEHSGITKKRLRYLRMLVKMGVIESCWIGAGIGGESEFGVGRFRMYFISKNITPKS